jgi:putative flippase GtrA
MRTKDLLAAPEISGRFAAVVVVDDGSPPESQHLFDDIRMIEGVEVLRHAENRGKGEALKTAFSHVLFRYPDAPGIVTADSDGQHRPDDITAVASELEANPYSMILGVRDFPKGVPWRSGFGNRVSRAFYRAVVGKEIRDTQTGLRGIPMNQVRNLSAIAGSGYDFETECLIMTARSGVELYEIPIQTLYFENNRDSHFRPIRDSLKIYFVFLRFAIASLLSAFLDFAVFGLAVCSNAGILPAIIMARIASLSVNFLINKHAVFKARGQTLRDLSHYLALAVVLLSASYGLIMVQVRWLAIHPVLAKAIAETVLFLFSFTVQKTFVFNRSNRLDGILSASCSAESGRSKPELSA